MSLLRSHVASFIMPQVEADWAVELGAEDESLEVPWAAPGNGPHYVDLKRHPELLQDVEEACRERQLGEFLTAVNAPAGILETAKCDVWAGGEISPEEEIFGVPCKFGSYVDILYTGNQRFAFAEHESLAKRLSQLLKRVPDIPAAAEFIIRRCLSGEGAEIRDGFYITFYMFGYGADAEQAHRQWAIGLKLVENAIRQLTAY
jgi:hypothetical protein